MTRTGKSPRLLAHAFEPYAEFHPDDARMAGLENGGLARLTSPWGEMVARVVVTRRTAARLRVRADALERRVLPATAGSTRWSIPRPIRSPASRSPSTRRSRRILTCRNGMPSSSAAARSSVPNRATGSAGSGTAGGWNSPATSGRELARLGACAAWRRTCRDRVDRLSRSGGRTFPLCGRSRRPAGGMCVHRARPKLVSRPGCRAVCGAACRRRRGCRCWQGSR